MPLTIFSAVADPADALPILRKHGFQVSDTDSGWEAANSFKAGLFKKTKLKFSFDREWCSPPNWPTQIAGMQNYFRNGSISESRLPAILGLVESFRSSIGIIDDPGYTGEDPRFEVIHEIAKALDATLFTPGALLDAEFRTLVELDGSFDPEARFPETGGSVRAGVVGHPESELDEDEPEPNPPSPHRVARRAMCLSAVAARGLLEMNLRGGNEPAHSHGELLDWIEALELWEEMEPQEAAFVRGEPGSATEQETMDAVWRLEGLLVLAWSLGLMNLAPYDETVDADELLSCLGFPLNVGGSRRILSEPVLKSPNSLAQLQNQLFAFHWRMVDFRVRAQSIDFEKMQEECWFGPLDLSWAKFAGKDLAIQGEAIAEADRDLVRMVGSIAAERHLAANWLMGESEVYFETEVNT